METNEKLRVVLDTNVVLSALSPKLPYRQLLLRAIRGEFEWCVTTEVLLEYEEKIIEFFGTEAANTFLEALLMSSYVRKVDVFYRFNVLVDVDDNKFVDCAFAANANFIVTDDKGFTKLDKLNFPTIARIRLEQFISLLEQRI